MAKKGKSYKRMKKEKYGEKQGTHYKPWANIRFNSRGVVSRVSRGLICNREFVFYSILEYFAFLIIEFDGFGEIQDIREQFPLQMEECILISESLGVRFPRDNEGEFAMRTIDLLVTYKSGDEIGFQIKPSNKLTPRALQKFQIEKIYLENRGISFKIITEKDINFTKARNLNDLRKNLVLTEFEPFDIMDKESIAYFVSILYARVIDTKEKLFTITNKYDEEFDFPSGTGLSVFRHLIINRIIDVGIETELFNSNKVIKVRGKKDIYER